MTDELEQLKLQPENLEQQQNITIDDITVDHPSIISRQATINIGTIGHVSHGKTSLTHMLTSRSTLKQSKEKEKNITIKLGYANAKIFECMNEGCRTRYFTGPSDSPDDQQCSACGSPSRLHRHISIVDCPGHDVYMDTMLSGAALMDAAILLVAADIECPQSQTSQHVQAVSINKNCVENLIVAQNKIDLVNQTNAETNHEQIVTFLRAALKDSKTPKIIPISATMGLNIKFIVSALADIPLPQRDFKSSPLFIAVRSFDSNKSGTDISELQGGILGGSLIQGVLRLGDVVEIRPGIIEEGKDGIVKCFPLRTRIMSLKAEEIQLRLAIPGGLIGVGTLLDPSITKQDNMVGRVLGYPGQMPPIVRRLRFIVKEMKSHDSNVREHFYTHQNTVLRERTEIQLTVMGCNVGATVVSYSSSTSVMVVDLKTPVCIPPNSTVAIQCRIELFGASCWRLYGQGIQVEGIEEVEPQEPINMTNQ